MSLLHISSLSPRQRAVAVALLTAAIAGGATLARSAGTEAAPPQAKAALAVAVAKSSVQNWTQTLSANGNIAAWQEAIIGTETNGLRLIEVRAQIGDRVRKGDVLALFADESVRAEFAQAKATLAEAEAAAAEARANAARAREIQNTGALSAQQLAQFLTGDAAATARLEAAKAVVAAQQVRLNNTRLLAPDDGIITARNATVGAVVGAGMELYRMIRQGRLEWRAEVTASELGRLRPGMAATVVTPTGSTLSGRVRTLAPTVDVQTRNSLVYVDLSAGPAGQSPARAGMFARGEFALGQSTAQTIPASAVVSRDGFDHVFKVGADLRVRMAKVQTGRRQGDRVEVLQGLTADTDVVVQGAGFLNDGDLVRVSNGQGAKP